MREKVLCRSQLARMLGLIVALRAKRFPNAVELAESFEVSRRTVYRDLDALIAAGVPVRYQTNQQGYDIAPSFFLPSPALDEQEVFALVIQTFLPALEGRADLGPSARRGLLKIIAALPDASRSRASALLAALGPPVAGRESRSFADIVAAVASGSHLRVWVRTEGEEPEPSEGVRVSHCRITLTDGAWCLAGRTSGERRASVSLPIARIVEVAIEDTNEGRWEVDSGGASIRMSSVISG